VHAPEHVGDICPAVPNWPALHGKQLVEPADALNWPAGHGVHDGAPAALNSPGEHVMHNVDPATL
jgi:hypothetical protein